MANLNRATLTMNRDSRSISNTKPKIRIIHIFAPEIIMTDTQNFRDLVRRLTGKPSNHKPTISKPRAIRKVPKLITNKSALMRKEELGMWNADTSGGFLNDFAHLEEYDVHEPVEFLHLPLDIDASGSSPSSSS